MIYIDSEFKCHTSNPDGIFREVETDHFNGKCDTFIEGHCYDDSKGYVQIYPWKDYDELDAEQREYERQLLEEYEAALENSVPISELEAAYQKGVNSAYD